MLPVLVAKLHRSVVTGNQQKPSKILMGSGHRVNPVEHLSLLNKPGLKRSLGKG